MSISRHNDFNIIENTEFESLGEYRKDYSVKEETKNVFFDTKDINFLSGDNIYNFSVNFSQNNNNFGVAHSFKNITSISLIDLVIKDAYINLSEINYLFNQGSISLQHTPRLERISDLRYIIIEITDINNLNHGTNNNINKASFILRIDDERDIRNNSGGFISYSQGDNLDYKNINNSLIPDTPNKTMIFKPMGLSDMLYSPSPKNILKNLKIQIKTPYGAVIKRMNNYLTLTGIKNMSNLLEISMSEYFSPEEFSLGDRLIIKNATLTSTHSRKYDIETFINRSEGHLIINHSNKITDTKMFKSLSIPFDFNLLLSNSISNKTNTYNFEDFGLTNSTVYISGTAINLSQQICIGLQITTQKRDSNLLSGNII